MKFLKAIYANNPVSVLFNLIRLSFFMLELLLQREKITIAAILGL